jgi:hypothetical protein
MRDGELQLARACGMLGPCRIAPAPRGPLQSQLARADGMLVCLCPGVSSSGQSQLARACGMLEKD